MARCAKLTPPAGCANNNGWMLRGMHLYEHRAIMPLGPAGLSPILLLVKSNAFGRNSESCWEAGLSEREGSLPLGARETAYG